MKDTLIQLQTDLTAALAGVTTTDALEAVRVEYLGRKGKLADLMKGIATLSVDEKKVIGQVANDVKTAMESALTSNETVPVEVLTLQRNLGIVDPYPCR